MIAFLDSSVLVGRYLEEDGSPAVRALLRGPRKIAISRLALIEVAAAVSRAAHFRHIPVARRDAVLERLTDDLEEFLVIDLKRPVYDLVPQLVLAHPLRALDAVQLATCLTIRSRGSAAELWSNDRELIAAARAEGLKTVAL